MCIGYVDVVNIDALRIFYLGLRFKGDPELRIMDEDVQKFNAFLLATYPLPEDGVLMNSFYRIVTVEFLISNVFGPLYLFEAVKLLLVL